MNYSRYIIRNPKVCGGEPVIRGTRVTIRTILASLAEGASIEEILDDFPTLKEEDVRAIEQVDDWQGCFVIATEHKLRVLRPRN
jgi:uncharacterized protein (DUF433 family)